jgi:hypothetical protein
MLARAGRQFAQDAGTRLNTLPMGWARIDIALS